MDSPQSHRKRVLFVISDLSGGGAERVVTTYLEHLDRTHFEPGLCLWRDIRAYNVPSDVPVWVMHKTRPWHSPRTVLRMVRLIRKWQPDIVFSHLHFVNLLAGIAWLCVRKKPFWIPCVRNDPENPTASGSNPLLMPLMRRASRVTSISQGIVHQLHTHFDLPKDKLSVLYNPIDFDSLDQAKLPIWDNSDASFRIVTMGRLVDQKDHRTLLHAIAHVRAKQPVSLTILGEGPLRTELEALASALGIQQVVDFKGFVSNPFSIVKGAHLFVFSSKWEGLGNALIEAMGCGTPVVSTRCPYGPEEIINDGENGILVPVGDVEQLSQTILRLLDSPQERDRMSRNAQESVRKRFSAAARTRALEKQLSNISKKGL